MKVGDLVKVSNKGFTAIGYIKEKTGNVYYVVHYFATLENRSSLRGKRTGGIWIMTFTGHVMYGCFNAYEVINESR